MAQFPVDYNLKGSENIVDALNYVLSGPSGLGQNFSGISTSDNGYLVGSVRTPSVRTPFSSQSHGASGVKELTVATPGTVWTKDGLLVSKIKAGMYVTGLNIGAGAQVDVTYNPSQTPYTVPLTVANTGWVVGPVTFFETQSVPLYVAPIAINTITVIDIHTIKVNFATAQPSAPFVVGSNPTIEGTSVSGRNGFYTSPGIVECTTDYCIIQNSGTFLGTSSGGTIKITNTIPAPTPGTDPGFLSSGYYNSTDMTATCIINGAQDRAFISAQIYNLLTYTCSANATIEYTVSINRYIGVQPTTVLAFTGPTFFFDGTVSYATYLEDVTVGSGTLNSGNPTETIFTTVIDAPRSGLYRYQIDLLFRIVNDGGAAEITSSTLEDRSITAQVVKQ